MKTKFLYLMLICVWCIAACETQDEVKSESATVTISVTDSEGNPLIGKTVCMYVDAFPITYTNVIFGEHPIANDVLIATAETNSYGVVTFVIDGSELNNSFQRRFHFSVKEVDYQSDGELFVRCGDVIDWQISANLINEQDNPNNNVPEPVPDPEKWWLDGNLTLKSFVDRGLHSNFKLSGALDVTEFHNNNNGIRDIVSANFEEIVAKDAMKYASCVDANGNMDFNTVKQFCADAKDADLSVFGHTLVWHSQQQPNYLVGLMKSDSVSTSGSESVQNRCLVIKASDKVLEGWDNQFFIYSPIRFNEGDSWKISMSVKADIDATVSSYTYIDAPGNYLHWMGVGQVPFTTKWSDYTASGTFEELQQNGNYIGINLNDNVGEYDDANTYYFDNISLKINGEEVIINGNCEGDDFSCFYHSYNNVPYDINNIKQVSNTDVGFCLIDEQKRDTLFWAMDRWIAGIMDATDGYVTAWDVVNEPLLHNDSDGDGFYDLQHSSDNPGNTNSSFFWQDYIGDIEYVRSAVASARKHFKGNPNNLKLFINDYNLESDWDDNLKAKSLVEWVKRWESYGVTMIDGLGTQMHINCYEDDDVQRSVENHIVKMFQILANAGKLVRISELDMGYVRGSRSDSSVKTSQITEEEHQKMADFYKFIIKKYFEIVPSAQQYGICQWSLTDAPNNNSSWRMGEPVGIWTENFKQRKEVFRGYIEGLSEKDLFK